MKSTYNLFLPREATNPKFRTIRLATIRSGPGTETKCFLSPEPDGFPPSPYARIQSLVSAVLLPSFVHGEKTVRTGYATSTSCRTANNGLVSFLTQSEPQNETRATRKFKSC